MFIEIEVDSSIPIYLQLARGIMEHVASGHLRPGDSLPSVRSLAADLQMNMHTVNKAYHYLEEKKFIEIVPKTGVFIHQQASREMTKEEMEQWKQELRPFIIEALCRKVSEQDMIKIIQAIQQEVKG
ncbi:GntR family transcriptional regulator [Paenisporosarcina cavernae]|uniref:GntR family transcriptional regulator n=1 Tax=Paenisporosarcina cavernae TaxID=2320858 RepID=A0A385YW09_9BACL|nr:GntR family transcriptional regulator [Paenisporosarcina cavernae]AYC30661.1 GntR family transcriptional regulator [Paenisporosarcina cavernae]